MLKETIKFKDFNGLEREEVFRFNLSRAEVTDLELKTPGGFSGLLEQIIASQNPKEVLDTIQKIIKMSYGVVSADGRRFIKTEEAFEEFSQTEAYSELYLSLLQDEVKGAAFVKGIMPEGFVLEVKNNNDQPKVPPVNGFRPDSAAAEAYQAAQNRAFAERAATAGNVLAYANPSPVINHEEVMRQNQEYMNSQTRPPMPQSHNDENRPGFPI